MRVQRLDGEASSVEIDILPARREQLTIKLAGESSAHTRSAGIALSADHAREGISNALRPTTRESQQGGTFDLQIIQ